MSGDILYYIVLYEAKCFVIIQYYSILLLVISYYLIFTRYNITISIYGLFCLVYTTFNPNHSNTLPLENSSIHIAIPHHTIPCHVRPTRSPDLIRPGHFSRQCWADTLVDFKSVIKNDEKTLETELKKSKLISRAGPSLARQKVIKEVKVKERKKRKAKDAGSSSHNSHLAGTELGRMLEKIE